MTTLNSKRFVLRQSLIGKNQTINVTNNVPVAARGVVEAK